MGEMKYTHKTFVVKTENIGDLDVDRRITLTEILEE
jgi:hypothetical protein